MVQVYEHQKFEPFETLLDNVRLVEIDKRGEN